QVLWSGASDRYGRLWRRLAVVMAMVVLLQAPALQAQQPKASEYQVKATYLYNFSRFVQWPANVAAVQGYSFPICVIGLDPFGAALDAILTGETIDGKNVVSKRV